MKSTKLLELKNLVLYNNGLVLYDDLYRLLHQDRTQSAKVFVSLIKDSLLRYAQYYPIQRRLFLKSNGSIGSYKINDNFDQYLSGSISESDIILHPLGVYYVKGWLAMNAQWWRYDENTSTLNFRFSTVVRFIEYFANYPMTVSYGPDNDFTEDSKIYFLDVHEDETYRCFLSYYVIRYIRALNMSNDLNLQVGFLKNLDTMFSEIQEQFNDYIESRSKILRMWRK